MPRTGGVYSPPAGTKGVPNTTIQSVPYNTLIDDLTADANAPRPVTAGGTGATSASAARTALGLEIGTTVQAQDAALQSIAGLTTVADQMIYTTGSKLYSTTALTPFARKLLDDVDAATAKATLGLSAVASSGSASDLTTGTIADARLPSTMSGKTFTSQMSLRTGTATTHSDFLTLLPTDYGPNKPGMFFQKTPSANRWGINLWDGNSINGTLDINVTHLLWNGNSIITAGGGTLSGNLTSPNLIAQTAVYAQGANMYIESSGNRHLWLRSSTGIARGLLYHDNGDDQLSLLLYNNSGIFVRGMHFWQGGGAIWEGNAFTIDARTAGAQPEIRLYSDSNSQFRIIGQPGDTFYLQKSSDFFNGNASNLVHFNSIGDVAFRDGNATIYASKIELGANGSANNIKIGDDAWIGDTNTGNAISIRGQQDWNSGYVKFGGSPNLLGVNNAVNGDRLIWGSWQLQSDGNQYLPYAGKWLNAALDEASWRVQTWQNVSGMRTGGTSYQNTTGRPIMVSAYGDDGAVFQVSSDNNNWLSLGYSDVDQDNGGATTAGVIIPHGCYYRLINRNQQATFWNELR